MINITLFIQMIHFFIGWYLLDRLIFKPSLLILDAQEREHEQHKQVVMRLQHEIEQCKHERHLKWRLLQQWAKQEIPAPPEPLLLGSCMLRTEETSGADAEQVGALAQQLAQVIVKAVSHV